MNLQDYIGVKYKGDYDWFNQYVNEPFNLERHNAILDKKEYLNGQHAILNKSSETYKGKTYNPRKVVLQYGKLLVDFQTNYLLMNPITFAGNEKVIKQVNKINRKGKYDRLNVKILGNMLKYGEAYEYVYYFNGKIKSKIIDTLNGYPVYNHLNELIGFVEYYVNDGIGYWNVYDGEFVTMYSNEGGELQLLNTSKSLTGLPVIYKTNNELDSVHGRSELDDWISKLDEMEELISKFHDVTYKNMSPIPVVTGQQLTNESLNSNIVGAGFNLEDGATFDFKSVKLDIETFEKLYKTLMNDLLNISGTPAVALNQTSVANLSSESIAMMYTLSEMKASQNEMYLRDGLEERLNKFRLLLSLQGVEFQDDEFDSISMKFKYNTPFSNSEMLKDLQVQHEMGALSIQSIVELSPYTLDVGVELERLGLNEVALQGGEVSEVEVE